MQLILIGRNILLKSASKTASIMFNVQKNLLKTDFVKSVIILSTECQ